MNSRDEAAKVRTSELRRYHGMARFGEMTWPYHCEKWRELMRRARYAPTETITRDDLYGLLSLAEAYIALVYKTAPVREAVVARVREATEQDTTANGRDGEGETR